MTSQPLSYPCRNEVHRYLGIQKRMDLIKLVPALRKQNKTLGYRLTKVYYHAISEISTFLFLGEKAIDITETKNEDNDQNVDIIVEFREPMGISTSVRQVEFKNCEKNAGIETMAEGMVAFYLDRPGTIVNGNMKEIRWEHLRKWRNCIRSRRFSSFLKISTTEWWCELFRKVRAKSFDLEYDNTPGVLSEIVEFINSNLPIGTSMTLHNIEENELEPAQNLQFAGSVKVWGDTLRTVTYSGYQLMVVLKPSFRQHDKWEFSVRKLMLGETIFAQ